MIGFIRGKVHSFGLNYCLIDVSGVGYRIAFHHPEVLKIGEEITIYTYQNVREDEISLFGFLTLAEHDLFVRLISVKGLGPKIASNILAASTCERIIEAIETGDLEFMKRMPGVGNKTASQIILDLKGKLVESSSELGEEKYSDVFEALKQLGYKANEIKPVLKKLENEDLKEEEIMRKALGMLIK